MDWICVILLIVGSIFVAKKNILGWYLFVLGDLGLIGYNWHIEQYSQMMLFIVYTGTAVYGIYEWRNRDRIKK